jgi:Spinocerebellar ataxia type 10 protein domain
MTMMDNNNNDQSSSWSQKICQEYRNCQVPDERVHLLRRYARSIRDEMRNTNDCRVARTFVAFRRRRGGGSGSRSGDEDDGDDDNEDDHIHQLQQIAYDEWHEVLLQMATKDSFRILCNCITQNMNTAQRLLQHVPLEPTREQIRLVAHTNLLCDTTHYDPSSTSTMMEDEDDDDAPQDKKNQPTCWNWVDLIVAAARRSPDQQRATLAAVVACWYNATFHILSHRKNEDNDDNDDEPRRRWNKSSSSSPLFLATLLRHAIPMMTQLLPSSSSSSSPPDEATDWIRRAVVLYSRMYGGGLRASYTSLAAVLTVVPEQIVYLLLLRQSVESETSSPQKQQILESLLGSTPAEMGTNLQFLVQLVMMRSSFTNNNNDNNNNDHYDDHDDEMTTTTTSALQRDVHHLALELLNETLTDDTGDRRIVVGTVDGFMDYIITELAIILDDWHARGQGKSSRDAPIMTDDQQRFLIDAVRLLGNLTYQCPLNQNALRSSSVVRITTPKHNNNNSVDDDVDDRNGLHILLSTTGMAMSCFSVREWGIVAIRNALENNPANQAIVERLQAESAVQTTALDDMGLQINISKDGKATVTPKTEQQKR